MQPIDLNPNQREARPRACLQFGSRLFGSASLISMIAAGAQAQTLEDLKVTGPVDTSLYGSSTDISHGRAVVGAPYNGKGTSVAYIMDARTGKELHRLDAPDHDFSQFFGYSVACSGGLAVVGEPVGKPASAHVFDMYSGQHLSSLKHADADGYFGCSVDIDGNRAVVGAPGDGEPGIAIVFDALTGSPLMKLTAPDGTKEDRFAWSVAISGSRVLVGANGADGDMDNQGAVYVFDLYSGKLLHKLTADDGDPDDKFGIAISADGNLAIIGATGDDGDGYGAGAAYVFDLTTGQQLHKLNSSAGGSRGLGRSVDISGKWGVVSGGAVPYSLPTAAFIFDLETGKEIKGLLSSDGEAGDFFGKSVALEGGTALVGAMGAEGNRGAVYVFGATDDCSMRYCGSDQNSNNKATISIDSCNAYVYWWQSIKVRLSGAPAGQMAMLVVGNGTGTVSQPFGAAGDLCVAGGTCMSLFGSDAGQTSWYGTFSTSISNPLTENLCGGGFYLAPGVTWNFQWWHAQPNGLPSTFSDAISVTFK